LATPHVSRRSDDLSRNLEQPSFSREQFNQIIALVNQGTMNVSQIAQAAGLQRMAVTRIKADPAAAEAMLRNWML
jgi:putative DNA-invertase from lambdoid prophage Rac